ncbi:MAG: prepilin peptidase [Candidatus Korobacteraceae bacterium]
MDSLLECALFVVGLAFGSFLNVCISRIPNDESVVTPRSHCRACGATIRWHHNIPLASWLFLRGRCRDCSARISFRYPAVELLTAILLVACYTKFGLTWLTLKACVFSFLVLGLIFMDAETGLLPREFTYPGILLGLTMSWTPVDNGATAFLANVFRLPVASLAWLSVIDSLLGAFVGAGFLYVSWALYYLVRKRHGMGFGDISLMAMSGMFLGLKLTLFVIFAAPILGVLYALLLLALERRARPAPDSSGRTAFLSREIPFGTFLGACSLAAMFLGPAAWRWYLGMIR